MLDWAPHVDRLLNVEDDAQPHQGAGPGGGPDGLQAPRHVGVEGETISIPGTEVDLEVSEDNNNYPQSEIGSYIKLTSYSRNSFL